MDRRRRREYWNRIIVARQLCAENLSAHYAKRQLPVRSLLWSVIRRILRVYWNISHLNAETSSHLAVEPETSVRSGVNELSVEEAEQNNSVDFESDDSQCRKHLLSDILAPDTEPPNMCSNFDREGEFRKCTGCKFARYCSK